MGNEEVYVLQLHPHHVGRLVGVFPATVIATSTETSVEGWQWSIRIGLTERDFVTKESILLVVVSVVLADYGPIVVGVLCHQPLHPHSSGSVRPDRRLLSNQRYIPPRTSPSLHEKAHRKVNHHDDNHNLYQGSNRHVASQAPRLSRRSGEWPTGWKAKASALKPHPRGWLLLPKAGSPFRFTVAQ
jgi:hypothetical protein